MNECMVKKKRWTVLYNHDYRFTGKYEGVRALKCQKSIWKNLILERRWKYDKRGGLNKERGVSQKAEINKRPPPRLFGTQEYCL